MAAPTEPIAPATTTEVGRRWAYIARYDRSPEGKELVEVILAEDTYWSPTLRAIWQTLTGPRKATEAMLQGWYSEPGTALCMATTNQPYRLE